MINKITNINKYDSHGPGLTFDGSASGAADDWSYAVLGAAGMTFEIGTNFHDECNVFETDIVTRNIPALTYAARVAWRPFFMSKGPDILSIQISPSQVLKSSNASISVVVEASDSALSSYQTLTSRQAVTEIRVYLNEHPFHSKSIPTTTIAKAQLVNGSGVTQIYIACESQSLGRQSIYVQAIDSDGYFGPVATVWLEIVDNLATENLSNEPSSMPSIEPGRANFSTHTTLSPGYGVLSPKPSPGHATTSSTEGDGSTTPNTLPSTQTIANVLDVNGSKCADFFDSLVPPRGYLFRN